MNTEYSKEEMEKMGKDALKGSQSAYAHVHADGSVYLDHEDEKHKANKSNSVKVDNKALKKAEAEDTAELKAVIDKCKTALADSEKKRQDNETEYKANTESYLKTIESLEADKRALQEEIESLKKASGTSEKPKSEDKKGK